MARLGWLPRKLQGPLRKVTSRPGAPFAAVVAGVPVALWPEVEAAFPEFDKTFSRSSASEDEVVRAAERVGGALLFDDARRRLGARLAASGVTCFHVSPAPVPALFSGSEVARGFMLDSVGPWHGARRVTDFDRVLCDLDLSRHPDLSSAGARLAAALSVPASGGRLLIIAPEPGSLDPDADIVAQFVGRHAASDVEEFDAHLRAPWHDPSVQQALRSALARCGPVASRHAALGAVAACRGRRVVSSGQPLPVRYGLADGFSSPRRIRRLDTSAFLACVLASARFVNGGRLVDPVAFAEATA